MDSIRDYFQAFVGETKDPTDFVNRPLSDIAHYEHFSVRPKDIDMNLKDAIKQYCDKNYFEMQENDAGLTLIRGQSEVFVTVTPTTGLLGEHADYYQGHTVYLVGILIQENEQPV